MLSANPGAASLPPDQSNLEIPPTHDVLQFQKSPDLTPARTDFLNVTEVGDDIHEVGGGQHRAEKGSNQERYQRDYDDGR